MKLVAQVLFARFAPFRRKDWNCSIGLGRWQGGPAFALVAWLPLLGPAVASSALAGDPRPAWSWPLADGFLGISGTFMEARSAHFHTGLDLRTGGRVGLHVVAPTEGWIQRIRTSPRGYGKALYLRTVDGRTLVFAHLEAFAWFAQHRINRAQAREGLYSQDLWLDEGEMPVRQQQILALSGATGTGAPHLHVEVRRPGDRPANPLEFFAVPDERPPSIRRVRLVPLGATASIDGELRPLEIAAGDTVRARGSLGVQARLVDRVGDRGLDVLPLGAALRLDGREVYRFNQREVRFDQGSQMQLEFELDEEGHRRWLRLYRRYGNTLAHRRARHEGFSFELIADDELHRVELVAWDAGGMRDSLDFWIDAPSASRSQEGGRMRPLRSDATGMEIERGEAVLGIRLQTGAALTPPESLRVLLNGDGSRIELRTKPTSNAQTRLTAVDLAQLRSGLYRIQAGAHRMELPLITGGAAFEPVAFAGGDVRIGDPTGAALYPGGQLWVERRATPALPEGCTARSEAYALRGVGIAWRAALEVELRTQAEVEDRSALFLRDADGEWTLLEPLPSKREGRSVCARLDDLGTLMALRDTVPPVMGFFRARGEILRDGALLGELALDSADPIARSRWPAIELQVRDTGSGLVDDGPVAMLDGRRYPARWEPEDDLLRLEFLLDPRDGEHELVVFAEDRLGNRSQSSVRFSLRSAR